VPDVQPAIAIPPGMPVSDGIVPNLRGFGWCRM